MNYEQNNNGMNNNYNYNNDFNNGYNNVPYNNSNMNNNKQPLSYHIKRFLIGFLLVLIFIFLLLWLLPTKQDMHDAISDSLNPLYDRIFSENIETMKEVAIAYYTTDRLPKKEGDTKKLTLGEMLEMKLLLSIKDKNGVMCDTEESYVEITKMEKEYKMKVNLSCDGEEDYIIVYLGCYDYCLNDICEKKEKEKAKPAKKQSIIEKVTTKVQKVKETVKEKVVSQKSYYCKVVNGKYYDDNGKVVSKAAYQKACVKQPAKVYYCKVVNGKYYDANGKVVSKAAYEKSCKKEEPVYKYLYEKKVTTTTKHDTEYSEWSPWSDNIEYDPNNNDINWGTHELVINEKVGYKLTKYYTYEIDESQPIYNVNYDRLIGYKKQYACNGYTYYIDNVTNTTYKTTGWVKTGRVTLSYKPTQTNTKRYVYVGMNYDFCGSTCTLKPYYIFDVYTRSATAVSTSYVDVSATCSDVVTKEIPIYGKSTTFAGYVTNKVLKEKKTYYYHYKTRKITQEAYTDTDTQKYTAWSYSKNDQILIAQGYKYTGKYEKVN